MIDFIVYDNAGKGKGSKAAAAISAKLSELGIPFAFHHTEKPKHATEIARNLCEKGAQNIIAVGGDGTVHEVLNGLTNLSEITFGIIPAGTGNDFAEVLGTPTDPLAALQWILDGNTRYVDFFDCGGTRGMNIVGCGIDVDILRHYESKSKKTRGQYFLSLLHCLIHYRPYDLAFVDEKGEKHEKKAFIACACNGKQFGGGIKICPVADIYDGYLDCLIVNDMPKRKMLGALMKLVGGKILQHPNTQTFHVKEFKMNGNAPLQIDGEIYTDLPFDVKIVTNTLKMFMPKEN